MSRKSIFEPERPGATRSKIVTRVFDLLLVGGYVICAVLTYYLFFDEAIVKRVEAQRAAAPSVAQEEASPASVAPTPELEPTTPTVRPPVSEDLLIAMSTYVSHINGGQSAEARAMRADQSVPSLENFKKVASMEMLTVVPYPRLSRTKGSVYVELRITKENRTTTWRGRVDWELRDDHWVTTDWDSSAKTPMPDRPEPPPSLKND